MEIVWRSEGSLFESFSSSIMWVSGIEDKSSDLPISTFTHWTGLVALAVFCLVGLMWFRVVAAEEVMEPLEDGPDVGSRFLEIRSDSPLFFLCKFSALVWHSKQLSHVPVSKTNAMSNSNLTCRKKKPQCFIIHGIYRVNLAKTLSTRGHRVWIDHHL